VGRPPAPTALKLVRGERADRINRDEPIPAAREVVCPADLSPAGQQLWQKLAPDMIAKGAFTFWDEDTFAEGIRWWEIYRTAMENVTKRGLLVEGARGNPVKNPELEAAALAWDRADRVFSRFGMTPSARAQLRLTPQKRGGSADRLLS
jgi:P27 family predicted phage terminase small subunit